MLFIVLALLFFGGGTAAMFYVGYKRNAARRLGLAPIAAVQDGKTRIRGTVHAAAPLIAAYTERPCVYVRIEFRHESGADFLIEVWQDRCDFEVRDQTGFAQVIVERAMFDVVADTVEIGRASDLTAKARALLIKLGFAVPVVGAVKLSEAIVGVGDTIDISGLAALEPATRAKDAESGYRDSQATMPVFSRSVEVLGEKRDERFLGRIGPPT